MDFTTYIKHPRWLCSCQELAQRPPVEMQTYLVGEGLGNLDRVGVYFDRFKLRFQSACSNELWSPTSVLTLLAGWPCQSVGLRTSVNIQLQDSICWAAWVRLERWWSQWIPLVLLGGGKCFLLLSIPLHLGFHTPKDEPMINLCLGGSATRVDWLTHLMLMPKP